MFIHSSIVEQLGRLHFWAIMTSTSMNIHVLAIALFLE